MSAPEKLRAFLRSPGFFLLQDLSVMLKGTVASFAIYFLLSRSRTVACFSAPVDYFVGALKVTTDVAATNVFSGCAPHLDIENLQTLFLAFVCGSQLVFLIAIVLKFTLLFSRYALTMALLLCSSAFLLAWGKMAIVFYLPFLRPSFGCSGPSVLSNACTSKEFSWNISHVDARCTSQCLPSIPCTSCASTIDNEVYVLVLVFALSFMYICYVMYEYYMMASSGASPILSFSVQSAHSEYSEPLLHSQQDQDAEEDVRVQQRKTYFKIARDLSALAKYILTVVSLAILLSNSSATVKCGRVPLGNGGYAGADRVQTQCQPTLMSWPYLYMFIVASVYSIIFFVFLIIIEKLHALPRYAASLTTISIGAIVGTIVCQVIIFVKIPTLSLYFVCSLSTPEYISSGLCSTASYTSGSMGLVPADVDIVCQDVCHAAMPLTLHVLGINLLLSGFYFVTVALAYFVGARARKEE